MKSKKGNVIMVLSNSFAPDLRVYKEAKSLAKSGYRITLIAWDRQCKYPEIEHYEDILVRRIHIRASYGTGILKLDKLVLFLIYVAIFVKRHKFDCIHCHDLDTLPVGVFLKLLCGKLLVYDAHENFSKMILMSSSHVVSYVVKLFERCLIKFVDSIIVASKTFGSEVSEKTTKSVNVIGNWQSLQDLDSGEVNKIRQRLRVSFSLLITYIGGLDKSRSLIPMIEAMKSFPDFRFIIYGNGVQRDVISKATARMKNVSYMGRIPQNMVPYYTAASDVIYYVMDYSSAIADYNAPNSLGFALTNGRAVIASHGGELGRIVETERCGVVVHNNTVEATQHALEVFRDKDKLKEMQRCALMAGKKKYNWDNMEHKLVKVYDEVMSSRCER